MRHTRILFLGGLLLAGNVLVRADEYDDLRTKWRDILTGGTNLNLGDSAIQSRLASIANTANNNWSTLDTSPTRTYLWADAARTNKSQDITTCFDRLRQMALAWATRGCSLETNAALGANIISGLDWMYTNRYNENITSSMQYDNWWDWQIGSPQRLNNTAVLMYPALSSLQISNYLKAVDNFNDPGKSGWMTGANTTDKCQVAAIRGIIGKSATKLATARDKLSPVFPYVTNDDGFYTDGSFIQHTAHPYTGSYGSVLMDGLSKMLWLLDGATWQVTNPARTNIFRWVYDAYEPVIYKGAMMDNLRGRAISRLSSTDHTIGAGNMASILQIAQFAPTNDALAFKRMLKYWIQADTFRNFTNNVALSLLPQTRALMADTNITPRGELIGHYRFHNMDRVVHLRPGFGFAISMSSARIYTFESINSENLRGWFTGDGMTTLYNDDLGQFGGNFWATVDPYHLPGTTVEQTARTNTSATKASGQSLFTGQNWVGGSSLEDGFGTSAMALDAQAGALVAKKAWFMFDKEIVCLGAGITCTSNTPIHTTIENRKLGASATNQFIVNNVAQTNSLGWSNSFSFTGATNWTWLAGVGGCYFPANSSVSVTRESRTNTWYDINQNSQPTASQTNPVSENYLKLWMNHGNKPTNATYAYTILPNLTASQTAAYAVAPDLTILSNTTNIQAVKEATLGIVAANFWNSGTNSVDYITVNNKASVIARETNGTLAVALSDPTQTNTGSILVTLNRTAGGLLSADAGVTVVQLSPKIQLAFNVNGKNGKSLRATLTLSNNLVAAPDTRGTAMNTPVLVDVLANDSGGQNPLSLVSLTAPAHGTAVTNGSLVRYTPTANFTGPDNFSYTITDGSLSATGSVTINVGAPTLTLLPPMLTASTNDGNLPQNTVDGDLNTRWSASGAGQWIQYDLLSPQLIDAVSIAFYSGAARISYLNVQCANDGTNWTQLFSGQSSGTATNLERFEVTNRWARYVRIVGNGNSVSAWNSYTEVQIHTAAVAIPAFVAGGEPLSNGNFRLKFSGSAGMEYILRASTNIALTPLTSWTPIATLFFGDGTTVFDDLTARNFPRRYYLITLP